MPYTYSWAPIGETTDTAVGLSAGNYTVTAYDACGGSVSASVTITQPTVLSVSANTTSNAHCNGSNTGSASSTVTGGTTPYTYLWSGGGTNATKTGLSAGTYTLNVTDHNGCAGSASITITQPTGLNVSASTTANALCGGINNGSAASSVSGGILPYTYTWLPSGGNTDTAIGLSAGTYTLTVKDNNGCSGTAVVSISQPTNLNDSAYVAANILCHGTSGGSATSYITGGTTPYTYLWHPGGETTDTATFLSAGTYTLNITDNNGCTASATVTLTQPDSLTVSVWVTSNINCFGDSNGSAASSVSGGTPPYTYSWSGSAGNNPTASGLSAGTYTLTVNDACGAAGSRVTITITQPNALYVSLNIISNVNCNDGTNGSISANVSGGTLPYTYLWSPSGENTDTAMGLSADTYTLNITDNNGCSGSATATITQPNSLSLSVSLTNVTCHGLSDGSAYSYATGGTKPYTYLWTGGEGTNSSATGLKASSYILYVTDSCGSLVSLLVNIIQPNLLYTSIFSIDDTGSNSGSAWVQATGGTEPYTYLWTPGGQTTDSISGLFGGRDSCIITDSNGCTVTTEVVVNNTTGIENVINNAGQIIVYPNPNNGLFTILSSVVNGQSSVEIYNVLGQRIYSTPLNLGIRSKNEINISDKASGVYFYRVLKDDGALLGEGKILKE